jgi:hypothetical protein
MQQLIIYGRLQDLILLFKIPMGMLKDFFKIYIENLGKVPSEMFASPGLCCGDRDPLNT